MRSTPSEARGEGRVSAERDRRRAARERVPESEKGSSCNLEIREALDAQSEKWRAWGRNERDELES